MKNRRLISMLCAIAMSLTLVLPVSVAAVEDPADAGPMELAPLVINGKGKTPEEIDREIQNYITLQIGSSGVSPRVQDYYTTVTLPYVYKTVSGYPGNQSSVGGYRFPTGGGFFYSENGGPEATVNISVSAPFGTLPIQMSVGVSLGNRSDTFGVIANAPDPTKYYKLYVEKQVEIRPTAVYRVSSPNAPVTADSTLAYTMHTVIVLKTDPYAKEV